jgi:hypothetical protein
MDNRLPPDFAPAQRRLALANVVRDADPMELVRAIAQEWPAKLGRARAVAYAKTLADMIERAGE